MGLSKYSGVHPYVADRIRYLVNFAADYGIRFQPTSGFRTTQQQWQIWTDRGRWGPARPGCSTHEYGMAMDVYHEDPAAMEWFRESARNFGLYTLRDSPYHFSAFPGSYWVRNSSSLPNCPDPVLSRKRVEQPFLQRWLFGKQWAGEAPVRRDLLE